MVDVCDATAAGSVEICGGNSFYEGSARVFLFFANGRPRVSFISLGSNLQRRRGGTAS